jgi:hypothetical protein
VTGIKWSRLYDLKGTADDKTLMLDNEPLPEARCSFALPASALHALISLHIPTIQAHKRWYNLPWLMAEAACGVGAVATPEKRRRYAQGKRDAFNAKLHLPAATCDSVLAALRDDAAFLGGGDAAGGLMDYSLIVGVAEGAEAVHPPGPAAPHAMPLVSRRGGKVLVFYCGVIDFLQTWNSGKKAAHVIKACCAPHPISTIPPKAYALQFVKHFEQALLPDGEAEPAA